jgi:hypothetical protein
MAEAEATDFSSNPTRLFDSNHHGEPWSEARPKVQCGICAWQYWSDAQQDFDVLFSVQQSKESAQKTVEARLMSIESNRARALSLLEGNEDRLMSRWRGKTRNQRQMFLNKHFPSVRTDEFWSTLACGKTNTKMLEAEMPQLHETIIRPFLTTNKLLGSWTYLLALIHHRTAFGTRDWLSVDMERIIMIWKMGLMTLTFVEGCIFIRGSKFGQLEAFNSDAVHRHTAAAPHLALAALEMHDKALKDILGVVQELAIGLSGQAKPQSAGWKALVARGFEVGDHNNDIKIFSFVDGYSSSPLHNLSTVLELIRSHADAEEDELRAIETDFPYFLHQIHFATHAPYWGTSISKNKICPAAAMVVTSLHNAILWKLLYMIFERLELLVDRHSDLGLKVDDPPDEYCNTFRTALLTVQIMQKRSRKFTKLSYFKSPDFKQKPRYLRRSQVVEGGGGDPWQYLRYSSDTELYDDDPLTWCMSRLSSFSYAVPICLPIIHQIFAKDVAKRKQLNPLILVCINELTVLWSAQQFLRLHYSCGNYVDKPGDREQTDDHLQAVASVLVVENTEIPPKIRVGSEIDSKSSLLKFIQHSGRQDAAWLARADEMEQKFADVLQSIMCAARESLTTASIKDLCAPFPESCIDILGGLWMREAGPALHPTSFEQRARITEKKQRTIQDKTPAPYVPFPNQPKDRFVIDRSSQNATPRKREVEPKESSILSATRQPEKLTAQESAPDMLAVSRRAYRIAKQLFSDNPPEDKMTLEDVCVLMGTQGGAGFKGISLHGSGFTFRRVGGPEGRGERSIAT